MIIKKKLEKMNISERNLSIEELHLPSYHCDLAEAFKVTMDIYNQYFRMNLEREILTGNEKMRNVLRRIAYERNIFNTYVESDTTLEFAYLLKRDKYISQRDIRNFLREYQKKYGMIQFQMTNLKENEIRILGQIVEDMKREE
jgi:hypothetical protein